MTSHHEQGDRPVIVASQRPLSLNEIIILYKGVQLGYALSLSPLTDNLAARFLESNPLGWGKTKDFVLGQVNLLIFTCRRIQIRNHKKNVVEFRSKT